MTPIRLLGNWARNWRWKSSERGMGRTTLTASTSAGPAPARSRQVAMARSGSAPATWALRLSLDSSTAATRVSSLRTAAAVSPRMPPIPRVSMSAPKTEAVLSPRRCRDAESRGSRAAGSCGPALLDFRPRVFQRDRAVEDGGAGLGVGVDGEVAEALELVVGAFGDVGEAGFQHGAGEDFERVGIEV